MLIRPPMAWRRLFRVGLVTPFAVLAMAAPAHASMLAAYDHASATKAMTGTLAVAVHTHRIPAPNSTPTVEQTVHWNLPATWSGRLDRSGNPKSDDQTIWNQTLANGHECGGWWQVDVYRATRAAIDAVLADGRLYAGEDDKILKTATSWDFEKQPVCLTPTPTPTPTPIARPTPAPTHTTAPTATRRPPQVLVLSEVSGRPPQVLVLGEVSGRPAAAAANRAVAVTTGWESHETRSETDSPALLIAGLALALLLGVAGASRAWSRVHDQP